MMANETQNSGTALELLDWQLAAGVDLAMGEEPVNRFAQTQKIVQPNLQTSPQTNQQTSQQPAAPVAANAAPPAQPAAAPTLDASFEDAEALAAKADDLEALQQIMETYEGCGLKLRATQLVFGDGDAKADIMLVGEAPGRDEDIQGKPFVGRSGALLTRMIEAIGLERAQIYLANTVPWRPPGNRTPTQSEIAACLPFLHRQIALVDPKILVTIGAPATQTLCNHTTPISRARGKWQEIEIGGKKRATLPMLHPSYLLRQPAQKKLAWQDLLALKARIATLGA